MNFLFQGADILRFQPFIFRGCRTCSFILSPAVNHAAVFFQDSRVVDLKQSAQRLLGGFVRLVTGDASRILHENMETLQQAGSFAALKIPYPQKGYPPQKNEHDWLKSPPIEEVFNCWKVGIFQCHS